MAYLKNLKLSEVRNERQKDKSMSQGPVTAGCSSIPLEHADPAGALAGLGG